MDLARSPIGLNPGPPQSPTSCKDRLAGGKWRAVHDPKNPLKGYSAIYLEAEVVLRDGSQAIWLGGSPFNTVPLPLTETATECRIHDPSMPLVFLTDDRIRIGVPGDGLEMTRTWGPPAVFVDTKPPPREAIAADEDSDIYGGLLGNKAAAVPAAKPRADASSAGDVLALLRGASEPLDVSPPMTVAAHIKKFVSSKATPTVDVESAGEGTWDVTVSVASLHYSATVRRAVSGSSSFELVGGSVSLLEED